MPNTNTYAQQLDNVQAAIAKIELGAQVVDIEGTRYERADLNALYRRETRLLKLINYQNNGAVSVADFQY